MYIYQVVFRYKYGTHPWECRDTTEGYWKDLEEARAFVRKMLGENCSVDDEWGFDIWTAPERPRVEYSIVHHELR